MSHHLICLMQKKRRLKRHLKQHQNIFIIPILIIFLKRLMLLLICLKHILIILEELKERGLYFLDSRTSQKSVGYKIAQKLGLPCAYRHVFLDHKKDLHYIEGQIDLLINKSLKKGKAVGIGHLTPTTIKALKRAIPKFEEKGIILVTLSQVVE